MTASLRHLAMWLFPLALPPVIVACRSDARSTLLTAPSAVPENSPQPTLSGQRHVRGLVQDAAFRVLQGATVEVIGGAGVGLKTITDAEGLFSLAGDFDNTTRFRASQTEYVSGERVFGAVPWIWFKLDALAPPANIAGNYTVTFVADANRSCERLPEEFRSRSYVASIARGPTPSGYNLSVSGATIIDLGYPPIGVVGNIAGFALFEDGLPYLVEKVPDGVFTITGYAQVSVPAANEPTIVAPFEGWIEYIAGTQRVRCESKQHQMILTRR